MQLYSTTWRGKVSKIIISKINFRNIDQIFQFSYQKNEMLVVVCLFVGRVAQSV